MNDQQTIALGPRGPRVPAVGVGTWQWGDRMYWGFGKDFSEKDIFEAFEESVRAGVTFFDTARGYSNSEERIGKALEGREYIVATKSGNREAEGIYEDVGRSLAAR